RPRPCGTVMVCWRKRSQRAVRGRAGQCHPSISQPPRAAMKPVHAILLVEDNPADIKITERALRESALPVELIVVRDGQEAVEYLQQQNPPASSDGAWRRPDLILLDLNLARLSGHEVLRKVRSMVQLRTAAVSGWA